jgi:preprotein translocase subunit YajC
LFEWLESTAWAQTGSSGGGGGGSAQILGFVPFVLIFALFYFLLVMPQQKRARKQKEMIDSLKKGERVSTSGGIIGTVTNLTPKVITLQVADGVRIKVVRTNIEAIADGSEKKEEKGK